MKTHLEILQVWRHSVCPHLVPLDHVSSVLGVATHRSCAVTLVEALVDIFDCELEVAVSTDGEGLGRFHIGLSISAQRFRLVECASRQRQCSDRGWSMVIGMLDISVGVGVQVQFSELRRVDFIPTPVQ